MTPRAGAATPTPILFVHHAGIDWIRGSTRCLLDLLTHINRQRFAPIVWCNQPVIIEAVRALDVPVHQARHWGEFHPLRPDWGWIRDALALIRHHGIRLIHTDEFTQASVLVPAARRAHIPLVAQLHQVPTPHERRWSLLHQVDVAVGTTRACLTGLLADGFPPERAVVIYNGIDPERLAQGDATDLRTRLGIRQETIVFTLVGSLIHRKAIDVALHAHARLLASGTRAHLLVCGSGPERPPLEALVAALGIGGHTTFLGECPHAGAIMRDATDVLIAPSRDESFGLTLAEAGLFGVPVVASNIPAHIEVVGSDAGLLVPVENPEALADAMRRVVADASLRGQLGAAAQRRTTRLFLVDRYVREFEDLYARLLAAPASAWGWRQLRWPPAYNSWIGEAVRRRLGRSPRPDSTNATSPAVAR
jgi:glycosyltransferase involved in cell wall biosynthesis